MRPLIFTSMPEHLFATARDENFKFSSAIPSLWLRHKLVIEK